MLFSIIFFPPLIKNGKIFSETRFDAPLWTSSLILLSHFQNPQAFVPASAQETPVTKTHPTLNLITLKKQNRAHKPAEPNKISQKYLLCPELSCDNCWE